jgi:hypothetical protein
MNCFKSFILILLFTSLASCSFFKKKSVSDADVIARVNEEYLYASDIKSLTKGLTGTDSIEALKSYANTWVRKRMLLQKAVENIPEDDLGVTKKIQDYRETLVLYEYEKALINKKLDTVIRSQEINDWYEKRKNDFLLEQDVFLLFFIKTKKDAPDLDEARKWIMKPKDEEDLRKLEGYCKQFAISYVMDNGMWYEKDKVLKNFPLNEYDVNTLAGSKSFREFKSDEGAWFIRIADVFKKGDPAPVQFIRDKAVRAIIEKRRLLLVEKIYERIYQDGIKSKSFEVFVK